MKKLLILILFGGNLCLFAQAPSVVWEHSYDWPYSNVCYNAASTADGGFIMVGNAYTDISGAPLANADMNFLYH
ncbi:hypothetical protein [Flavobacterium album]|nr:hypothetical protein [Flavobacterium album]